MGSLTREIPVSSSFKATVSWSATLEGREPMLLATESMRSAELERARSSCRDGGEGGGLEDGVISDVISDAPSLVLLGKEW